MRPIANAMWSEAMLTFHGRGDSLMLAEGLNIFRLKAPISLVEKFWRVRRFEK